jgi:3-oxoadipate CoA-transferase, alpha subunit
VLDKTVDSVSDALEGVFDGAVIMISGFGLAGQPVELIDGLIEHGASDLTIISNNAGNGDTGLAALIRQRRVKKIICSFPRQSDSWAFDEVYRAGEIELELVPQGNLAERIRAGGAGIPAFYSPTSYGTPLAEGMETREFDGTHTVLQRALKADFALVSGLTADRWGNVIYRKTSRNFGPMMLSAATTSVVQVKNIVDVGELDPETIVTPGIFVNRVVAVDSVKG